MRGKREQWSWRCRAHCDTLHNSTLTATTWKSKRGRTPTGSCKACESAHGNEHIVRCGARRCENRLKYGRNPPVTEWAESSVGSRNSAGCAIPNNSKRMQEHQTQFRLFRSWHWQQNELHWASHKQLRVSMFPLHFFMRTWEVVYIQIDADTLIHEEHLPNFQTGQWRFLRKGQKLGMDSEAHQDSGKTLWPRQRTPLDPNPSNGPWKLSSVGARWRWLLSRDHRFVRDMVQTLEQGFLVMRVGCLATSADTIAILGRDVVWTKWVAQIHHVEWVHWSEPQRHGHGEVKSCQHTSKWQIMIWWLWNNSLRCWRDCIDEWQDDFSMLHGNDQMHNKPWKGLHEAWALQQTSTGHAWNASCVTWWTREWASGR